MECPTLTDDVVMLDALTLEDAEAHLEGEDEEQARRFGWWPRRSTLDGVREFIQNGEREWRENSTRRTWAVRDAATHVLVGGCEARLQSDRSAHLSWWTFPGYRRRGFASRGVRLMLRWLVDALDVRQCVSFIEPDNIASRHVARKAGMAEVGIDTSGDRLMLRYQMDPGGTIS